MEIQKIKIWLPYTERSELALIAPLIKRLKDNGFEVIDNIFLSKDKEGLGTIYPRSVDLLTKEMFDLVIISFDRREQVFFALASYHMNVPIMHLYSGDYGTNSPDEKYRHFISSLANICCVHSRSHVPEMIKRGISKDKIHFIGSMAFDGFEEDDIDYLHNLYFFPYEFDVVLLHPEPRSKEKTELWIKKTLDMIDKFTIFIAPNNDTYNEMIREAFLRYVKQHKKTVMFVESFHYTSYRTLMRHAKRLIGNSSSFALEAPFLGQKNIVWIGDRNSNRIVDKKIIKGAIDRIIKIIKEEFSMQEDIVGGVEIG